jgi:hypothetical protein
MRISEGHVMSVPSGANLVPVLNSQGYSSECKKPNISSSPIKELIGGSLSGANGGFGSGFRNCCVGLFGLEAVLLVPPWLVFNRAP